MEMVNVVDVSQHTSIDQVSSVLCCFDSIFGQTHFNQPINETIPIENFFVNFDTPSFILSYGFATRIQMIICELIAHMSRIRCNTIPIR